MYTCLMSEIFYADERLPQRFWDKAVPEVNTGCWLWNASTYRGYGRYNHQRKPQWAYAVAYKVLVGPVPEGLELDHVCRQPACVHPDHLEPVTHLENMRRGRAFKHQAEKMQCENGHDFTEDNVRRRKDGGRDCKQCDRNRGAVYGRTDKGRAKGRLSSARYQERKRRAG